MWKMIDIWVVLIFFVLRINIFVDLWLRSYYVCFGNNFFFIDNFFFILENGDCFFNCCFCLNCNWECFYFVNIVLFVFNIGR